MGRRQKKERYAGMARRRRMGGQGGQARTSGFVGEEDTNWRRREGAARRRGLWKKPQCGE
jgi:hypothetical protein